VWPLCASPVAPPKARRGIAALAALALVLASAGVGAGVAIAVHNNSNTRTFDSSLGNNRRPATAVPRHTARRVGTVPSGAERST